MAVIVDSDVLIDGIGGRTYADVEKAIAIGTLVLSPLVVAEVLSGELAPIQRAIVGEFLQDFKVHETPLAHWLAVGDLRRVLRNFGLNVTIPDAHVAQCAIDLNAVLYSRDDIFVQIARHAPLRLGQIN